MANPKLHQLVCIDFETGGLDCLHNPATQIGLKTVRADTLEPLRQFATYIQGYHLAEYEKDGQKTSHCPRNLFNEVPEGRRRNAKSRELLGAAGWKCTKEGMLHDWGALDYTNTTLEKVADGMDAKDLVNRLCEEFSHANTGGTYTSKPILLGHNICFDVGFLQRLFALYKKDLSKYLDGKTDAYGNFQPAYVDTLNLSRARWYDDPTMPNYQLGTCCERAGVELVDAHEAMADVNATVELYSSLIRGMRNPGGATATTKIRKSRHDFVL